MNETQFKAILRFAREYLSSQELEPSDCPEGTVRRPICESIAQLTDVAQNSDPLDRSVAARVVELLAIAPSLHPEVRTVVANIAFSYYLYCAEHIVQVAAQRPLSEKEKQFGREVMEPIAARFQTLFGGAG